MLISQSAVPIQTFTDICYAWSYFENIDADCILEVCNTAFFSYFRQRQCQYGIENASKNAPVQTNQPTGVGRFQASPSQSQVLRSGRPSGIPVKTSSNCSSLKQGKVNQLRQQEGARGSTAKCVNYAVVSQVSAFKQFPEKYAIYDSKCHVIVKRKNCMPDCGKLGFRFYILCLCLE
jgi:hypothetical protein